MAWQKIIGQERIKNILQRAIIEGKVPQSYLFWGEEGIGKEALAIEFAKVTNCINPALNHYKIDSCEECESCKAFNRLQHPNLELIFSLPPGKSTDSSKDSPIFSLSDEQIQEIHIEMKLKVENPYHHISLTNATQIKIGTIRDLKRKFTMTQNHSGRRFAVIFNAEDMTNEAANSFLKILEEPHENITFILISSRYQQLLQTILSRCQQLHFQPTSDEDLINILKLKDLASEEEARIITAFAQGSYSRALEFISKDIKKMREEIINTFRISLRKSFSRSDLLINIDNMVKSYDKNQIEHILNMLILWLHDAIKIIKTNEIDRVTNIDQIDILQKFISSFGNKDLPKSISIVENSISQIYRNVAVQLILVSMFVELRTLLME